MRGLYGAAIVSFVPLAVFHGVQVFSAIGPATAFSLLAGVGVGLLVADIVTGLVHWACDTWGDERTSWLGPGLIRAFREHHRDPLAMLDHDWIEVNGEVAVAAATALGLLSLPAARAALAELPFWHALVWSGVCGGALANQLHQWAHRSDPPACVRLLQRAGLILSPARHARHHRAPFTGAYCISTGWSNPLLDAIGFWRGLERAVGRVTGARPRRHALSPRSIRHSM